MHKQMARVGLLFLMCGMAGAQTSAPKVDPKQDPKVDALMKDVADLKRTAADQERRIAELEKTLAALQAVVAPLPTRLPEATPAWHKASSWNQIKLGMGESQVVDVLGPPTSVQVTIDMRVLLYTPDPHSTSTLNGSVTLVDDRVTAMNPPAFER
jgi:hypothetical protein